MRLLVDAGNTRIKWAVFKDAPARPGEWSSFGVVPRSQVSLLANAWQEWKIESAVMSNVAGPALRQELEQALQQACGKVEINWFQSRATLAGIQNGYRHPEQLGSDRFASAIGAHALYPQQALIVATCGTATTIDAITAGGLFMGGMILPGLGLMANSLAINTAQLPQVGGQIEILTPFADNTHDAIVSGCIAAQTGAIEHAAAAQKERQGSVLCIVSGGAASMIAPHLSIPSIRVDNLVLMGLHVVALQAS